MCRLVFCLPIAAQYTKALAQAVLLLWHGMHALLICSTGVPLRVSLAVRPPGGGVDLHMCGITAHQSNALRPTICLSAGAVRLPGGGFAATQRTQYNSHSVS
jgi:hypothetical protein